MSILPPSRPETEPPSRITYMLTLDDILSVADKIADITSNGTITPERTACLDEELKAARDRIPGPLKMAHTQKASDNQADNTIMQHTLEMIYQRSRCILHRQYLVSPRMTNGYETFRWACVDAARCVLEYQCELFQDILRRPGNRKRSWFGASHSVSDCLTAAMVICLDVLNEPKGAQAVSENTRAELIQLLNKTYLSLKNTPRPSVETAKAAERVATMLYEMGHSIIGEELRCSQPAAAETSELSSSQLADQMAATIEATSSPYTTFQDILNGDCPLEMFDWSIKGVAKILFEKLLVLFKLALAMDELLCSLFLSEDILNMEATCDPSSVANVDEVVQRAYPKLKRFIGYKGKISKPKYMGKGEQGFVFRFKHKGRYLCLKLLEQLREASGRERSDPRWSHIYWAVVKDFIPDEPPSSAGLEQLQNIVATFNIPKYGNILPRDVKKENYRAQRMVDLGSTIAFPFYRRYASEFKVINSSIV
ncbi:hypothetical protein ABOM_002936 [Aspergillus bombycis]|uniref:Uncharacterized protein n=1 Tax=Aspergillus bombycis TaxID=109264 RepID=A0A1F8A9W5_9EURO|nr:hypothetical protein ABOM_002936 [Aspergillus bombycis]OGM48145.1 hypothetical protein ABOM_002936 [Aspergillus bombycis]